MHVFTDDELGQSAGRVWTVGRANPVEWEVRTALGVFTTHDKVTWHGSSGEWVAELRRSRNGHHLYLAMFEGGVYRGRFDASGWHTATERRRIRHLRSYQLPLVA